MGGEIRLYAISTGNGELGFMLVQGERAFISIELRDDEGERIERKLHELGMKDVQYVCTFMEY